MLIQLLQYHAYKTILNRLSWWGGKIKQKNPPQTNRQTANLKARTPSVKGITAQQEWRSSRDSLRDFLEWKESHGAFGLFGQALYTGPHPRSPKFILGNMIWLKSCLLRGGWSIVKGWNQVTFKGPIQPDNTCWIPSGFRQMKIEIWYLRN